MTNREFFTAIVNASDVEPTETQWEELKAFATEAIAKLDARNAKRANTPSKTQKENAPLIEKIASLLTSEPKLASELAKEMEISTQKASALVKKVEGVSVCDVKVKGKGTQKGYYFAQYRKKNGLHIRSFFWISFFVRITYEIIIDFQL